MNRIRVKSHFRTVKGKRVRVSSHTRKTTGKGKKLKKWRINDRSYYQDILNHNRDRIENKIGAVSLDYSDRVARALLKSQVMNVVVPWAATTFTGGVPIPNSIVTSFVGPLIDIALENI